MTFEKWWTEEGSKLSVSKECAKTIWNEAQKHRGEELAKSLKDAADYLAEAAELLEEVRTGEDFEVICWEKADKLKEFVKNL